MTGSKLISYAVPLSRSVLIEFTGHINGHYRGCVTFKTFTVIGSGSYSNEWVIIKEPYMQLVVV